MKTVVGMLIVGLLLIEFLNLIYTEVLVRGIFKRVYNGNKKLSYSKKVVWLKANIAQFDAADQQRVYKIVFHRKLSIYVIGALFVIFFSSLLLGINK